MKPHPAVVVGNCHLGEGRELCQSDCQVLSLIASPTHSCPGGVKRANGTEGTDLVGVEQSPGAVEQVKLFQQVEVSEGEIKHTATAAGAHISLS